MQDIWVYSENNELSKQLVTLGKIIKEDLHKKLYVLTTDEEYANEIAQCGIDMVYLLRVKTEGIERPESLAKGIAQLCEAESPYVFFIGGTMRGEELGAKVAAFCDAGMVTDAINVIVNSDVVITERLIYGGLAILTEKIISNKTVITIPDKSYEATSSCNALCEIITKEIEPEQNLFVVETSKAERKGADLTLAKRIVCVGRGLSKKEDLVIAQNLANTIDAEIGCTRPISEDYQWLPEESYIGLSGVKVKPELYISMGVSGQVQHVVGIRDSKVIVAIDVNENAPIFEAADYGIVGDLYDVVPAFTEALGSTLKNN